MTLRNEKVNLCPCSIKDYVMTATWGSGSITPRILELGTSSRWTACSLIRFSSQERAPRYPLETPLGGPHSPCGHLAGKHLLSLPGIEHRSFDRGDRCLFSTNELPELTFLTDAAEKYWKAYLLAISQHTMDFGRVTRGSLCSPVQEVMNETPVFSQLLKHRNQLQFSAYND